ncbi:MAG: Sugar kinase, ribokinase family [Candidatus Saccharibacteria bacterium]|nr:Sugar kinase, ribokinase family [Candidatus Saccharibacteria bacterium]
MPAHLASLVGESEKSLTKIISKFEELSGFNGEDIRLVTDIKADTRRKIESLGLDPHDTTGQELHHALRAKLQADSQHLARALNFKDSDDVDSRINKLTDFARQSAGEAPVLALKATAAKELLRKNPPKKLMKHLNYRSLESLLKREDMSQVFAAAPAIEAGVWSKSLAKAAAKLKPADFETREIKFLSMNSKRWALATDDGRPVTDVPLMGAVACWPAEVFARQESVYSALLLLQAAEALETDSFYLKTNQFSPDFGKMVANLFANGEQQPLLIEGQPFFSWSHLRCMFEDYEQPLTKLANAHPVLSWWKDSAYLAFLDDEPVSLNLGDNLRSSLSGSSYKNRHTGSFTHRVRGELLNRYTKYQTVKNYILNQFDDTFIAIEPVPAYELDSIT